MKHRKDELSPAAGDIGLSHQVAIREDRCTGKCIDQHRAFFKEPFLCSLRNRVRHDHVFDRVFRFKEPEDSILFKQAFNGVPFYPEDRGKGPRWMLWNYPPGDVLRPGKAGNPFDWRF